MPNPIGEFNYGSNEYMPLPEVIDGQLEKAIQEFCETEISEEDFLQAIKIAAEGLDERGFEIAAEQLWYIFENRGGER